MSERKLFKFYKSYFDVYNELSDKDKIQFIDALLKKQFENIDPIDLKGMAKIAYVSIRHSVEAQVKGWEDKVGVCIIPPIVPPSIPPCIEEEVKEKEKEEVKEEVKTQIENSKEIFENFRKLYPGTKKGFETEYENFKKKYSNHKELELLLLPALQYQIKIRFEKNLRSEFVPEWKNLSTWINNRCWEEVIGVSEQNTQLKKDNANLPHLYQNSKLDYYQAQYREHLLKKRNKRFKTAEIEAEALQFLKEKYKKTEDYTEIELGILN